MYIHNTHTVIIGKSIYHSSLLPKEKIHGLGKLKGDFN